MKCPPIWYIQYNGITVSRRVAEQERISHNQRGISMKLSAPSFGIFLVSVILALLVVLSRHFGIEVPILTKIVKPNPYEVMLVAWGLLAIGVAFNV